MEKIFGTPIRVTSDTLVHTGKGFIFSLLIGGDTINDPVISVHDALNGDTATNEIVPSNTYDADALGINGFVLNVAKPFNTGFFIKVANIGSGSVIVDWRSQGDLFPVQMR